MNHFRVSLALIAVLVSSSLVRAGDPVTPSDPTATNTRYGLWNLLDHRSKYATNWFPEPLLADEMDWDQELRLDWFHSEKNRNVSDSVTAEVEYSIGLLTLEVEMPYERGTERSEPDNLGRTTRERSEGIGNVEIAARHPIYQYVSGKFDLTIGARVEVAIPTNTSISKNTEVVPGTYFALGLSDHFAVLGSVGYSMLFGPGEDGGGRTLEYALLAGYNFEHDVLPIPGFQRVTPIIEIDGERPFNKEGAGINSLTGVVGLRFAMKSIGLGQPKFGIGYAFPIDKGARDDFRWGIVTSLIFEY